jgi:hypothetical protein
LKFCFRLIAILPRRLQVRMSLTALLLALPGCRAQSLKVEQAVSADAFVDSIGINIHLHNGNMIYGNFPVISSALRDLGVRHTRDGLIHTTWEEYYRRHVQLAQSGIHCLFITGAGDTQEQLLRFTEKVHGAAEGFEAPNEYDASGDQDWAPKLLAYMPRLMLIASSIPSSRKVLVVGPALVTPGADKKVPGLSASFDEANMHNYFGGHNPGTSGWGDNGYGSIRWNMALAEKAWGKKPIVTTETGYLSDTRAPQGVGELAQGVYTPRIFLEQALHGVQRTWLYELADGDQTVPLDQRSFGLLRSDGSRKPAFVALQRLIRLLSDPGPAVTPSALPLVVKASTPEIHHLLFQKRDGRFYLAFWLEVPALDSSGKETDAKPVSFTLRTDKPLRSALLYTVAPGGYGEGAPVKMGSDIALTAQEYVSILEFSVDR